MRNCDDIFQWPDHKGDEKRPPLPALLKTRFCLLSSTTLFSKSSLSHFSKPGFDCCHHYQHCNQHFQDHHHRPSEDQVLLIVIITIIYNIIVINIAFKIFVIDKIIMITMIVIIIYKIIVINIAFKIFLIDKIIMIIVIVIILTRRRQKLHPPKQRSKYICVPSAVKVI